MSDQAWSYQTIEIKPNLIGGFDVEQINDVLTREGLHGWELVSTRKATLIKWRNRHDTCLRADRGALTQMDWPSFKAVRQRAARRQASPNRLICIDKGGAQKARQPHRAACQGNQPSLRHPARLANLLNAMTVVPLDQRCLNLGPMRPIILFLKKKR